MKASDIKTLPELIEYSQLQCEEENFIDGIVMIHLESQDPIIFSTVSEHKVQNIQIDSLGSQIYKLVENSDELILSDKNISGKLESIIYEFEKVILVVYRLDLNKKDHVYLTLINSNKKNLALFNLNRPIVREKIFVACKHCKLEQLLSK